MIHQGRSDDQYFIAWAFIMICIASVAAASGVVVAAAAAAAAISAVVAAAATSSDFATTATDVHIAGVTFSATLFTAVYVVNATLGSGVCTSLWLFF